MTSSCPWLSTKTPQSATIRRPLTTRLSRRGTNWPQTLNWPDHAPQAALTSQPLQHVNGNTLINILRGPDWKQNLQTRRLLEGSLWSRLLCSRRKANTRRRELSAWWTANVDYKQIVQRRQVLVLGPTSTRRSNIKLSLMSVDTVAVNLPSGIKYTATTLNSRHGTGSHFVTQWPGWPGDPVIEPALIREDVGSNTYSHAVASELGLVVVTTTNSLVAWHIYLKLE